jgi:hypothetical protein
MKLDKHGTFLFTFTKGEEQMSSSTESQGEVKRWHVILFVTIAGLLTLLALFASARDLLLLPGQSGFPSVIHRWHEAQSGAFMTILFGGSLLALLWKPQTKPLLMQYIVLSIGIVCIFFATATGAGFTPMALVAGVVLIGILVAAYPRPRDLLNIRREVSLSYPLLALTVVAAVLLAPIIARELNYQILGMTQQDVHALNYHWLTSVVLALLLILGGSLAASRRPGWRALAFIIGITYLYLGSMALLLPDHAGSWGTIGGVLGLLGGLGYLSVTLLEVQRTRRAARISANNNVAA